MKSLILIFIFVTACSTTSEENKGNYIDKIWNVIENASVNSWSKEKLTNEIGKPTQIIKQPTKTIFSAWIYKAKSDGLQDWGISIKQNGAVDSITYLPEEKYRHEFTIEKIMARWHNLNCIHKTKQKLSPGLVKIITYLDCDNGHRIITYNMYKEVQSILVDY
jgi:hypothetical protein